VTDLTPEGIVRSYFNALNARDFARAAGPIAEDCEWTSVATGRVFRGPAANGAAFERRGCAVAEVRGGKIVRYRDYYDRATLLDQLDLRGLL